MCVVVDGHVALPAVSSVSERLEHHAGIQDEQVDARLGQTHLAERLDALQIFEIQLHTLDPGQNCVCVCVCVCGCVRVGKG